MDPLKQFLEDSAKYPDATEVQIGDVKVPLGSLRALNSSERTALADRLKTAEALEKANKERETKLVDLATKTQKVYEEYTARAAAAGNNPPKADANDPWADPWLAPVKTALSERDQKIVELTKKLEESTKTIANAATIWAQDRWDRQYEGINFGTREKKPTADELIKYATDNKLLDRQGIPSITAAWNHMTAGEREADMKKQEFERGREAGRAESLAARVTPPGAAGPGVPPPVPVRIKPGEGDLGDLYSQALQDPELKALLEQAAGAGIV